MIKAYLRFFAELLKVIWLQVGITVAYSLLMWVALVAGAFLILQDVWRAMGVVSAYTLFNIIKSEFYRDMYGARNPVQGEGTNAVQEQSKGDDFREVRNRPLERNNKG